MNCSKTQECLSAYHDNELSPDAAEQVAAHLAGCPTCAEELASFQQITELSQKLTDPPVPSPRWSELQTKLDPSAQATASVVRPLAPPFTGKIFALAATVLVAVGFWGVYQVWFPAERHGHLAMNFSHYLEEFSERPDIAQQTLLAKYNGRPIALAEAAEALGYEPVAARGLPPGYSVKEVHLIKMPCCMCAQVICTNKAGESIAVFEHAIDQPVWFGDRPSESCLCDEVPTNVRQIGNRLAATWKEGERHITIIGATDLNEVTEFVAHFKNTSSG